MVKAVERKKNEKRGQPPLSDLGDSPLDEKQQRKRTCCASVPALLRRSRRVNPNPDADKIRHGKPEKRVEIHPKKEDKQVSGSDFYNDMLTWNLMTAEEEFFYTEHVLKSDGFDVPLMRCIAVGLIQPRNINTLVEARRFILYSNLVIDEYNTWIHTHKPESPQLKFRKVLKAMSQSCDLIRYYITFVAKEVAAGGQTKTYQAVVRHGLNDYDITVLSFRECEQLEGSGFRGKEWFWKGHTHL